MTRKTLPCLYVIVLAWSVLLSGCAVRQGYDKKHYVLVAIRQSPPAEDRTDLILEVRRFTVDSAFADKGFVYRIGQFEYESDLYNEFLVSPSTMITERVRNWLSDSGVFTRVLEAASQIEPTHVIEGHITSLYGDLRDKSSPRATIEMRISLLKAQPGEEPVPISGEMYRSSVAIESREPEGLVEALDRCLANVLSELEKDLMETAFSVGE